MRATILTLVFAAGTLPIGFAQTQTNSTTEKTEEHATTTVNPDGTAVHNSASTHEKTDSSNSADGTSTTTKSRESKSKTKVRTDVPADSNSTTEHHSSTSTSTTQTNP